MKTLDNLMVLALGIALLVLIFLSLITVYLPMLLWTWIGRGLESVGPVVKRVGCWLQDWSSMVMEDSVYGRPFRWLCGLGINLEKKIKKEKD